VGVYNDDVLGELPGMSQEEDAYFTEVGVMA
jgi:hypothetical protein